MSLAMSALVAGLTVGGKALGKSMAMHSCTSIVFSAGKVIHWLKCIPQLLLPVRGGKKSKQVVWYFEYSGAYTGP